MKAIQTRYGGYLFRSRLEARWAVFLDALGLKWDYEPEGYELPSGRYLPDFFVHFAPGSALAKRWPGAGYWVEIKREAPSERERSLMQELCFGTKHHGYIVFGLPAENVPVRFNNRTYSTTPDQDAAHAELCSRIPPVYLTPFNQTFHAAFISFGVSPGPSPDQVEAAAVAARSARFEFKDAARPYA